MNTWEPRGKPIVGEGEPEGLILPPNHREERPFRRPRPYALSHLCSSVFICGSLLSGFLLFGCAENDPVCTPTDVQVCSCGTLTGTRVCNADGTGWTACSCSPLDADADADVDARDDGAESDGGDGETIDDASTETDVPPPPPCNELTFNYRDAAASTVWVSGTFNGWPATAAAGALEMTRSADLWSVDLIRPSDAMSTSSSSTARAIADPTNRPGPTATAGSTPCSTSARKPATPPCSTGATPSSTSS